MRMGGKYEIRAERKDGRRMGNGKTIRKGDGGQLAEARRRIMRSIMGSMREAGANELLVIMEKMMVSGLEPAEGSM